MASSPSFQGSESAARSFKAFSTPRSPNLVCPSAVLERTKEGFLPTFVTSAVGPVMSIFFISNQNN